MPKAFICNRNWLLILGGCLGLSPAAAPSPAAPKARHRAKSNAPHSAPRHYKGSSPDVPINRGLYDDTYHAFYVPPHKKQPAFIVVSMHLEGSYAGMSGNGSGSFRRRTPRGKVLVKWERVYEGQGKNVDGTSWSSTEFSHPAYTLTIDSPKALPVQLKTQEYALRSVSLNGAFVRLAPHLSGEVADSPVVTPVASYPHESQYFTYTFPGGHNVVVIQSLIFYVE